MEKEFVFDDLPRLVHQLAQKIDNLERQLNKGRSELDSNDLLNVKEAAQYLNLKATTIYSKVSQGQLPYRKRFNKLYFIRGELLDLLKQDKVKTESEVNNEAHLLIKKPKKTNK